MPITKSILKWLQFKSCNVKFHETRCRHNTGKKRAVLVEVGNRPTCRR